MSRGWPARIKNPSRRTLKVDKLDTPACERRGEQNGLVHLVLPMGFDAAAGLPPELHRYAWRAAFALHMVCLGIILDLSRYLKSKRISTRAVPLNSKRMEWVCGSPGAWNKIRKHWLESGVLVADPSYQVGKRSKRYSLGPAFGPEPLLGVQTTEDKLLARRIRDLKDEHLSQQPATVQMLVAAARDVTISTSAEQVRKRTWLATPEGRAKRPRWTRKRKVAATLTVAIEEANRGNHGFTQDPQGRVHSVFTRVPREIRKQALRSKNQFLVEVDIAGSEPLIMGYLAGLDHSGELPNQTQQRYGDMAPQTFRRKANKAKSRVGEQKRSDIKHRSRSYAVRGFGRLRKGRAR
jgi:hypothetical protein